MVDDFEQDLAAVIAALEAVDPAAPAGRWRSQDQTASFWFRRLAHETVVHRADAEAALGEIGSVATDLAVDGIDEALDLFLVPGVKPHAGRSPATVHLHATDGDGEWLVLVGPDGVAVERGHIKGDAAVRGSTSDLFLWLWGRVGLDRLDRFGDEVALERLRAAAAAVT